MDDIEVLISPTEPVWLKDYATRLSLETESYGCDILINSPSGYMGIQRKKFPEDIVASIQDGRLQRQVAEMQVLPFFMILFEGYPSWTNDGQAVMGSSINDNSWASFQLYKEGPDWFNRTVFNKVCATLHLEGVPTVWVADPNEFIAYLDDIKVWWQSDTHSTLATRAPEMVERNRKGRMAAALQVVKGVGPKAAKNIAEEFELVIDAGLGELEEIPGVGPKMAERIYDQFGVKL